MKKYIVAVILTSLTIGCASQQTWIYHVNNYTSPNQKIDKSVVVLPLDDARDNFNSNKTGLGFIPLFPFGWMNYSGPEGSARHIFTGLWVNYNPKEDFSKALAQEITATNLFREAYFDYKKGNGDFIIKGKIINSDYKGKLYTYLLSCYGVYLWFVGCPAGSISNDLTVELTCIDAINDKLIFSKTYQADTYKKIGWIYSIPNDFKYPELLKQIYKDFTSDLRQRISTYALQNTKSQEATTSRQLGEINPVPAAIQGENRPQGLKEKLIELEELKAQGLISEEEYQAKRKQFIETY